MAKKLMAWKTKGMNRDLSVSSFSPEFAFENINLRLSTNEGNTLLSWVNERGTLPIKKENSNDIASLSGTPIGTAILNHQLVVFTTGNKEEAKNNTPDYREDYIYKFVFSDDEKTEMKLTVLYRGNLNFSTTSPLETRVSYEEENVQKVYWTDGRNQPRVINIVADAKTMTRWQKGKSAICAAFDFVPELSLNEDIWVEKTIGGGGIFAPGVIQYAFTYYNKYAQESNIFYTTPLLYVSYSDRGGSPEDKIDNTFKINISNVDEKFEYLRIYSIQRTSIDGTPICKRLQDIYLEELYEKSDYPEENFRYSTHVPEVMEGIKIAGPDIEMNRTIQGKSVPCYGYRYVKDLKVITKEETYTFGSAATINSVLWISKGKVNFDDEDEVPDGGEDIPDGGETPEEIGVYIIFESPKEEDTEEFEPVGIYSEPTKLSYSYIDKGTDGELIDPTELLYKGGEQISALTMEQKDNTLFFGNIAITREQLSDKLSEEEIKKNIEVRSYFRKANTLKVYSEDYPYCSQLTAKDANFSKKETNCAGFKRSDYYRCGVQFQDNRGKWSDPIFIEDIEQKNHFSMSDKTITIPTFKGTIKSDLAGKIKNLGYTRARAVVVFPSPNDRVVRCQGVVNPTLYTTEERSDFKSIYAQSSWFYRPSQEDKKYILKGNNEAVSISPFSSNGKTEDFIPYTNRKVGRNIDSKYDKYYGEAYNPKDIRLVEIEGDYDDKHKFRLDYKTLTLNSPEVEFDTNMAVTAMKGVSYKRIGYAKFISTLADIDIQTISPTIHKSGSGFLRKASTMSRSFGIVSGLFYDDFIADEEGAADANGNYKIRAYPKEKASCKWLVYPWQRNGALNNDIDRQEGNGVCSSELKKKVISNLRVSDTIFSSDTSDPIHMDNEPQIFSSEDNTVLKIGNALYRGNVDTMLNPDTADGKYFAFTGFSDITSIQDLINFKQIETPFDSEDWWKTLSLDPSNSENNGVFRYIKSSNIWDRKSFAIDVPGVNHKSDVGDHYVDLVVGKAGVRMKYKSSPHIVLKENAKSIITWDNKDAETSTLPIVEISNAMTNDRKKTLFGGLSQDALKANIWLPCGEPVRLDKINSLTQTVDFEYSYGDTYFQRYDCLKTYAFTPEDVNQVVEIGSFMLETHINIDGRYDRNRGQSNNLNMSPRNFNLINMVYSQQNNFFSYRIQDEDAYKNTVYKNQITWSKTKENGADVDLWTNVTLASVLELDGDKGEITKLARLNDNLVVFQDTGISQILYNENVQISTENGVPIEIANSGKVQGKRYLSSTLGCSNKWSLVTTPTGIYFMDSNDKSIYRLSQGLENISQASGFNSWCKQNIPASDTKWSPEFPESGSLSPFKVCYDKLNQDVLFINKEIALAYSEKTGVFSSFYSYGDTPFFDNLDDTGIWLRQDGKLWKHQAGNYCSFFDIHEKPTHPYSMTLVGNPEPQMDKIFTNLEFRASVEGDGEQTKAGKFAFSLPFDSLETWDEYQHGYTKLSDKDGHSAFTHHTSDMNSSLKRKFRIWRCDIPRNNCNLGEPEEGVTWPYSTDVSLGISRHIRKPQDRMRNPWIYLKLKQDAEGVTGKTEIHDIVMTYFG